MTAPFASSPFGGFFWSRPSAATGGPSAAACRVLGVDGDYELATDGSGNLADAVDPLDEEIYRRLRTALASYSGDVTLGYDFARVAVSGNASPVAVRDECVRALQPMRDRGALSAITVTADVRSTQGTTRATYLVSATKTGVQST